MQCMSLELSITRTIRYVTPHNMWSSTWPYLCLVFRGPGGLWRVNVTGTVKHPVTMANKLVNLSLIVLVREGTSWAGTQIQAHSAVLQQSS